MFNKNIFILLISVIISLFLAGCDNKELEVTNDSLYTEKDLNPIPKEYVIKILKAKYGDNISITTEDIKSIKGEYVVEVYILLKDSDGTKEHIHKQSLGEHRINMYTGEIIENN